MSATTRILSKSRIAQGEIFYIMPLGEQPDHDTFYGGRPAVVISNDMINEFNGVVSVIYLTTNPSENLPTHVAVNATMRKSWAICDQITTVSKKRIGKYVGQLNTKELEDVKRAICTTLLIDYTDINKKSIEDMLNAWSEAIKRTATTDEISEYPVEDFETAEPQPDEKQTTSVSTEAKTTPQKQTIIPQIDNITDITTSPEYIKLLAERDIFKSLYTDLMKNMLSK